MKIDDVPDLIDPQFAVLTANGMDMDLSEVLIFELYNIPSALLDANGLPREAHASNPAVLKTAIRIIPHPVY